VHGVLLTPQAPACKAESTATTRPSWSADHTTRVRSVALPAAVAGMLSSVRVHAVTVLGAGPGDDGDARVDVEVPAARATAAPRRLATFMAGRHCATQTLCDVTGVAPAPIGVDADGAPIWPSGFVGSISHTDTFAMAAVARSTDIVGLGLDCERVMSAASADEISQMVSIDAAERAVVWAGAPALDWPARATLTFSVKESLYKCLRPLAGEYFGFHDARIVAVDGARVRLRLERDVGPFDAGRELDAQVVVDGGHAYSIVMLEAS
jgi:enterobactin synthetase component D